MHLFLTIKKNPEIVYGARFICVENYQLLNKPSLKNIFYKRIQKSSIYSTHTLFNYKKMFNLIKKFKFYFLVKENYATMKTKLS